MDRPRFLNTYQRRSLYFLDPTGTAVVPDPRWITGTPEQTASQLIGLLVEGPKEVLAPAVKNLLEDVTVIGSVTKADGRTTDVASDSAVSASTSRGSARWAGRIANCSPRR